jgi:hypothetical protein
MNDEQFQSIVADTFKVIDAISETKGREYADNLDRLDNFKRIGEQLGTRPEKILFVYLQKHLESIRRYVREIDSETQTPLSEPIEGRIDDAILYLILLKGFVWESSLHQRSRVPKVLTDLAAELKDLDSTARRPEQRRDTGPQLQREDAGWVDRGEVPTGRVGPAHTSDALYGVTAQMANRVRKEGGGT